MTYVTCFLLLLACKAQEFTPENYPKGQLIFGTGGGFTGNVKTYTLLENGQVFFHNSLNKQTKNLGVADKQAVKKAFKRVKEANFLEIKHNEPGNLYRFMEYKLKETSNRVVWAEGQSAMQNSVPSIYKQLLSLIPTKAEK